MHTVLRTAGMLVMALGTAADAGEREEVWIPGGFMTGEECLLVSSESMTSYMMGVVNGLLISPLYGAPAERATTLSQCLEGVTGTQLGATLQKWLRENPERWHEGCHLAAYMALRRLCGEP